MLAIASGLPFSNFSSAEDFPSSGSSRLSEAELQCDDPVAEFSTKAYKVPLECYRALEAPLQLMGLVGVHYTTLSVTCMNFGKLTFIKGIFSFIVIVLE